MATSLSFLVSCLLPPSFQAAAAPPTCTQWYQVVQGDSCPTIWNAANLTMTQFFLINPGIRVRGYMPDSNQIRAKSNLLLVWLLCHVFLQKWSPLTAAANACLLLFFGCFLLS